MSLVVNLDEELEEELARRLRGFPNHWIRGRASLHRYRNDEALPLEDPDMAYIVISGKLSIFSSPAAGATGSSVRRQLFTLSEGQAAFGCEPDAAQGALTLLGLSKGPADVLHVPISELETALTANDKGTHDALLHWVHRIGESLADGRGHPGGTPQVEDLTELVFGSQESVAPERGELLWIEVVRERLEICGDPGAVVVEGSAPLLATSAIWLQVPEDVPEAELNTWRSPGPQAKTPRIREGLAPLNRALNRYLLTALTAEDAEERERRRRARQLLENRTKHAYSNLSAVMSPGERFDARETPLLTACSIVGQVMGIEIHPPAASEDMARVQTPVEAIARSSKVRYRRVLLDVEWWERDCGPLVSFLEPEPEPGFDVGRDDDERKPSGEAVPVALLPTREGWQYVHPEHLVREPLTEDLRERLKPEAYMFYRSLPHMMPSVLRLLRFTTSGRTKDFVFISILGVLVALLGMVVPKATGTLIDSAIPSADQQLLWELFWILVVAGAAAAVLSWIQMMATVRSGTNADVVSQSAMWDRLLSFRPDFFRRFSSGDLQDRVQSISVITRELSGASIRPLITGLLGLLNWLLLWYYSWELAKIGLIVGLVVLVVTLLVSYFIRRLAQVQHDMEGAFSGLMVQMIGGVSKLRLGGAEQNAFNYWVSKYAPMVRQRLKIQRLQDVIQIFNLAVPPLCLALIFWKGVELILELDVDDEEHLTVGDFIAFNTAFVLYLTAVTDVSNTFVSLLDNIVKGRRIKPLLEANPEVPADATDPGRLTGGIRLENVSFRYVEDGPLILNDISLEIVPGECVAFVGPSGSGKSTLLRLLLGFDRPEAGRVLYDGKSLDGLDVLAVRRQIGTVLQNGRLNAASIIDNIANNANITHGEAWEAVADAGFEKDLEGMPMGLHTVISEGGGNLSGGQRQRLLIARAIATHPKIVFFDEATSALDNKTQAIVTGALDKRKVTRVVVAHRLSTIRNADRIYVFDRGVIQQQGTFEELTTQEGLFKNLVTRQMA